MSLYSEAVDRLFSARVAPGLWLTALAVYLALDLAALFVEAERQVIALLLFSLVVVVANIIVQWKATRSMSGAPDSQRGSVDGWIGWSLLSFLVYALIPIMIFLGIWGIDSFDQPFATPLLIVAIAVMASLVSPMLVHATGQVIGADGISFGQTLDGCRPFYLQLMLANTLISGGLWGGAEVLLSFTEPGVINAQSILLTIGSALFHFAAFGFLTALMTVAWSKASPQRDAVI